MTTPYNGDETGLDVDDVVTIAEPVDADPGNAATFAPALEMLADRIKLLAVKGGFLAKARSWTALQSFTAGLVASAALYSTPAIEDSVVIGSDARRLLLRAAIGSSTSKLRLYRNATNGLELTLNVAWNQATSEWVPDITGSAALYTWSMSTMTVVRKASVTAATGFSTWDVAAWNTEATGFTMSADWSGAGSSPLKYRITPEGEIAFSGAVEYTGAGLASGGFFTMFTMPAGIRAAGIGGNNYCWTVPAIQNSGSNDSALICMISIHEVRIQRVTAGGIPAPTPFNFTIYMNGVRYPIRG